MAQAGVGDGIGVRATTAATLCAALAVMPLFLTGGMAVLMRDDLSFSQAAVGAAASGFTAAAALSAIPGGRLAERIGARRTMWLSATLSVVSMAAIGLVSSSWLHLFLLLGVAGAASGMAQPSTNLLLAQGVEADRQGVAFGIKRSSFSVAELLAGLSVPAIALTLGWRATWLVLAAATGLAVLLVPPGPAGSARRQRGERTRIVLVGPLWVFALAGGFGIGAIGAMEVYFVESAVARGVAVGTAGLLLAVGGVAGIASRVVVGWAADRGVGAPLVVSSVMLLAGGVGFAILGISHGLPPILVGTVLAFGSGSGWTGLFFYGMVRLNPHAPAAATGGLEAGMSAGAVIGPLSFGALTASLSLTAAWMFGAICLVLAGALLLIGRVMLRRMEPLPDPTATEAPA